MARRPISKPQQKLEHRPEAKAFQLDELLRKVGEGWVRIPFFQRGLKWEDRDRLELFDSIHRGYPIGTLLFWQRAAPAARVALGRLALDAPGRQDALWVVDGQQRLATLAETLLVSPSPNERAIHFDLSTDRFVYRKAIEGDKALALPLSVALDSNVLIEWLLAHPAFTMQSRKVAIDVGKRIREYQVPCYIVETASNAVLQDIFRRVNKAGQPLDWPDFFHALLGPTQQSTSSGAQPADLRKLAQSFADMGFGSLDEHDVLKALLAVQGLSVDGDFSRALADGKASAALRVVAPALREAIVFLRRDAGIPHVELLPYSLPIVVLSKFFHLFPTARPRSRLLLRRWLWRGSLGARLTGAIVGMREHLACLGSREEEESVQRLLALAGKAPLDDASSLDRFDFRTARTKLQCCALASLGPRHLVTGESLDLSELLSAGGREKVPPVLRAGRVNDARTQGLANHLLHPRLAGSGLAEALAATKDDRVLASHAIPLKAQRALREGNAGLFLESRETALQSVVDRYFRRQAEWDTDDSPSLDSMLVNEEEP